MKVSRRNCEKSCIVHQHALLMRNNLWTMLSWNMVLTGSHEIVTWSWCRLSRCHSAGHDCGWSQWLGRGVSNDNPQGSSYPIVRDKDTFDCSDEWLPSRWENPSHEMKMAFIPFKVGRRSCPGPWAVTGKDQVRELLAWLVMDYEWSLVKETQLEDSITLMIMWTILQTKKVAWAWRHSVKQEKGWVKKLQERDNVWLSICKELCNKHESNVVFLLAGDTK